MARFYLLPRNLDIVETDLDSSFSLLAFYERGTNEQADGKQSVPLVNIDIKVKAINPYLGTFVLRQIELSNE